MNPSRDRENTRTAGAANLLGEVRGLYAVLDPVPAEVLEGARGALAWRTVDAELAELACDTASAGIGKVRSSTAPRLLTFEAEGVSVEVEVAETGNNRRLVGQLVPSAPAEVAVQSTTGEVVTTADELGRFAVYDIPAGPVRMVCTPRGGGGPVVTSWLIV